MNVTSTYTDTVYGDTYSEILKEVESSVATFLGIDIDDIYNKVSYELVVKREDSPESPKKYSASIIARVRTTK
jgi:hypothetical protein